MKDNVNEVDEFNASWQGGVGDIRARIFLNNGITKVLVFKINQQVYSFWTPGVHNLPVEEGKR